MHVFPKKLVQQEDVIVPPLLVGQPLARRCGHDRAHAKLFQVAFVIGEIGQGVKLPVHDAEWRHEAFDVILSCSASFFAGSLHGKGSVATS